MANDMLWLKKHSISSIIEYIFDICMYITSLFTIYKVANLSGNSAIAKVRHGRSATITLNRSHSWLYKYIYLHIYKRWICTYLELFDCQVDRQIKYVEGESLKQTEPVVKSFKRNRLIKNRFCFSINFMKTLVRK